LVREKLVLCHPSAADKAKKLLELDSITPPFPRPRYYIIPLSPFPRRCSHSDLERVNGALENLMRLRSMPAIDELIVENNKMPSLPARAFGALQVIL
jgi:hypothetical protein